MSNGPEFESKPVMIQNDISHSEIRSSSQALVAQNTSKITSNSINELVMGPTLEIKSPQREPESARQKPKPTIKPTTKIIKEEAPKNLGIRLAKIVADGIKNLATAPLDEKITASLGALAGYALGSSAAVVFSVPAAPLLVGAVGALMFSMGSREALKFTKYSLGNMKKLGQLLLNDLGDPPGKELNRLKETAPDQDGIEEKKNLGDGPDVPDPKPQNQEPKPVIHLTDAENIV